MIVRKRIRSSPRYIMSKTTLQPLQGYCLIDLLKPDEKTQEGLIVPQTDTRQAKGLILELGKPIEIVVGNEVRVNDWEIKKGDVVWFKRFAGEEINHEGKKLILVHYTALLGICL